MPAEVRLYACWPPGCSRRTILPFPESPSTGETARTLLHTKPSACVQQMPSLSCRRPPSVHDSERETAKVVLRLLKMTVQGANCFRTVTVLVHERRRTCFFAQGPIRDGSSKHPVWPRNSNAFPESCRNVCNLDVTCYRS